MAACQTHFMRNLLDATPKSLQAEVYQRVRAILDAPDLKTARPLLHQVLQNLADKALKAMQVLEEVFDDVTAVLALPERYRCRLRTTNGVFFLPRLRKNPVFFGIKPRFFGVLFQHFVFYIIAKIILPLYDCRHGEVTTTFHNMKEEKTWL